MIRIKKHFGISRYHHSHSRGRRKDFYWGLRWTWHLTRYFRIASFRILIQLEFLLRSIIPIFIDRFVGSWRSKMTPPILILCEGQSWRVSPSASGKAAISKSLPSGGRGCRKQGELTPRWGYQEFCSWGG